LNWNFLFLKFEKILAIPQQGNVFLIFIFEIRNEIFHFEIEKNPPYH
jgi:hypothetical protein